MEVALGAAAVAEINLLTLLALAELFWVAGLAVWIILERRSPAATIAWISVLAWLPLLGIAVYLAIGPRRLRRKRLRYRRARAYLAALAGTMRCPPAVTSGCPWLAEPLAQYIALLQRAGQAPPTQAQSLQLYLTGDECYAAIEEAIQAATHHIHLEYYIWRPDTVGTRLRDLLCSKARQGVQVRLLVDALGSASLGRRFVRPLLESGVQFARFNRLSLARLRPGLMNFRSHRKIVVCDGRVGFTGGINVCDEHSQRQVGARAWRDTHLRIEGAPVGWLQMLFLEDWYFAVGSAPRDRAYFPEPPAADDGPWVQIVASGPDHEHYAIERLYFAAIAGARQRVLITTPYCVPNEAMFAALATTAMRGVEVKMLVPARGDSRLVDAAARTYYEELAQAGVRVYQYYPAMLHAKTMVVDDQLALVGTANLDNRSFRLNFEVVAAVYDSAFAQQLADVFAADMQYATKFRLRRSRRAPLWRRLGEATARLLSPLL